MKKNLAKAFRKGHDKMVEKCGDKIKNSKHGKVARLACKVHKFKKK